MTDPISLSDPWDKILAAGVGGTVTFLGNLAFRLWRSPAEKAVDNQRWGDLVQQWRTQALALEERCQELHAALTVADAELVKLRPIALQVEIQQALIEQLRADVKRLMARERRIG